MALRSPIQIDAIQALIIIDAIQAVRPILSSDGEETVWELANQLPEEVDEWPLTISIGPEIIYIITEGLRIIRTLSRISPEAAPHYQDLLGKLRNTNTSFARRN